MKGLLASVIRNGINGDDNVVYRPRKQFTKQDIHRIAERGASEFRNRAMNLISCFGPLEGEFGLYSTLSNFIQTKSALATEINTAVQDGDEVELTETCIRLMEFAFATLFEKNALARLQLVENLPAEAAVEYARMRKSVANSVSPSTPVVAKAPVAPVIVESPIEACVREFHELGSNAFKTKWLNNAKNRPVYERAIEAGRI